jgi:DtxR family Mn-dependent transcriptional regulator
MRRYAAEIFRLEEDHEYVPRSLLAEHMDVSGQAVGRMLSRLTAAGLVGQERYRGVRLTDEGRRAAMPALRRHRLVEVFLVKVLNYGWEEAHEHADRFERGIDSRLEDRLDDVAGHPTRCPHGEPIPTRDGVYPRVDDLCLTKLADGAEARVSRVRTHDSDQLAYLRQIGLVPGVSFRLAERAPFEGPLRLLYEGQDVVLGHRLASSVWVEAAA